MKLAGDTPPQEHESKWLAGRSDETVAEDRHSQRRRPVGERRHRVEERRQQQTDGGMPGRIDRGPLDQPRQPDDRVAHERRHIGWLRLLRVIGRVGISGQAIAPSLYTYRRMGASGATRIASLAIWT